MGKSILQHLLFSLLLGFTVSCAQENSSHGGAGQPIVCEAEEFTTDGGSWQRRKWGENYYCATFANTFLSRKAYLCAPAEEAAGSAHTEVAIPTDGEYLVLARYEAPYRFQAEFRIEIEQNGEVVFQKDYGSQDNAKIWALRGTKNRTPSNLFLYGWGATENIVWEGHDALATLEEGPATLHLKAQSQSLRAADRNVDLILLTPNTEEVAHRIRQERYLPLDGLLTQSGDLDLTVENLSQSPLTATIPPGTEHSPYWVHQRDWKPQTLQIAPNTSKTIPVGHLLDTLNDGDWHLEFSSPCHYKLSFTSRGAPIASFQSQLSEFVLAYDADTRYSRRIRSQGEALKELVEEVKSRTGKLDFPSRFPVYGLIPHTRAEDVIYSKAREEFRSLFPLKDRSPVSGYLDIRKWRTSEQLKPNVDRALGLAGDSGIDLISLGDEIELPKPSLEQLRQKFPKIDPQAKRSIYPLYLYTAQFGLDSLKERIKDVRELLPKADIGANYSPHREPFYLGSTKQWLRAFGRDLMTMPWSEDYVWQVPVGSQQMSLLTLDLGRAAVREDDSPRLMRYVMPHSPGNTPNSWRRQFYGALMHGMTDLNLFEFRPVFTAYTENYVNSPEMYAEVARCLHELAQFEDILLKARPVPGKVGLWWGMAGDAWKDNAPPFGAAKRSLYVLLRHLHYTVEPVTFEDDLGNLKAIVVTDRHLDRASSEKLAKWTKKGGHLLLVGGAGLWDELDEPNDLLRALSGTTSATLDRARETIAFIKQDLPYAEPLVTTESGVPALGAVTRLKCTQAVEIVERFKSGEPAVVRSRVGGGTVTTVGYLPGLAYFHPAIPEKPVDRGTTDQSMAHFLPYQFDNRPRELMAGLLSDVLPTVACSDPLVSASLLTGKAGAVVPMVRWSNSGDTVELTINVDHPQGRFRLASGARVERTAAGTYRCELKIADALVLTE